MTVHQEDVDFLAHFGVKGMKWGQRKDKTGYSPDERKAGRKEVQALGKSARGAIKDSRKAKTSAERQAAADKYEQEVVKKLRTKDFQEKYNAANTMGKGDKLAHVVIYGVFAPLTIAAAKQQGEANRRTGTKHIQVEANQKLKELRAS